MRRQRYKPRYPNKINGFRRNRGAFHRCYSVVARFVNARLVNSVTSQRLQGFSSVTCAHTATILQYNQRNETQRSHDDTTARMALPHMAREATATTPTPAIPRPGAFLTTPAGIGPATNMTTPDPDTNEARLARHRALHNIVHPGVAAASREADRKWMETVTMAAIQRDTAIRHLHALLNRRRTATQAMEAEREARDWLDSIGSEAP